MALIHLLLTYILLIATAASVPLTNSTVIPQNKPFHTWGSAVPFGAIIDHCSVPGTVALTFDDGPYMFTPALLDLLSANGVPCTFFLNGGGLGGIYNYADVVQRIWREGHQLGSHTWSHVNLAGLSYQEVVSQMTSLEEAFIQILGGFPVYMRPPYLAVDGVVLQVMTDLGYHVVHASVDTKDYENDSPELIGRSLDKFRAELDAGGTIVLAHDVHQMTVVSLVQPMLDEIRARGLRAVTIGECLGDPRDEWYRAHR